MKNILVKNLLKITGEELDLVAGGLPGIAVPGLPGTPYVTAPGDYGKDKKESRDGGATGSW